MSTEAQPIIDPVDLPLSADEQNQLEIALQKRLDAQPNESVQIGRQQLTSVSQLRNVLNLLGDKNVLVTSGFNRDARNLNSQVKSKSPAAEIFE